MQNSLTIWHRLLCTTGGKLVPEKCFWYMIDFKWQNQQWKYKTTTELKGQISVIINQTNQITIPRLKTSEARQILGVRIAPDGNDKVEVQYLKEVAAMWGRNMVRANLNQMDAEFSLQQVLLPKLLCPLMITNFTKEQCQDILRPALLTSELPAMGINQHFPRAVIHSPKSHQGLDIPNLYTKQLCTHIVTLLRFQPQPKDPTGHLIHAKAKAFQLEAGLAGLLFQMSMKIIAYMTNSWFTQTWYQCQLLQI